MGIEIEHKFLVKNDNWKSSVISETPIEQGFLTTGRGLTVRVRRKGGAAYLTVKGPSNGTQRSEFEYAIPPDDADAILQLEGASGIISKIRYQVRAGSHTWDLDVFHGDNAGLIVAEVELSTEGEPFDLPDWAGDEVTDDTRYFNASLAEKPYCSW